MVETPVLRGTVGLVETPVLRGTVGLVEVLNGAVTEPMLETEDELLETGAEGVEDATLELEVLLSSSVQVVELLLSVADQTEELLVTGVVADQMDELDSTLVLVVKGVVADQTDELLDALL